LATLDNGVWHVTIMTTMNGLLLGVVEDGLKTVEDRLKTVENGLKKLLIDFNSLKHNFEHLVTQLLHSQQSGG
jgi:hypothetical protein